MDSCQLDTRRLRYLSADHVEGPTSTFARFDVRTLDDGELGRLDGIIIDPAARRTCYLVVDVGVFRHRRYLLPLGPTRVDEKHRTLRVNVDGANLMRCAKFDPGAFPGFSDDDLLTALFHRADREHAE
jgi:hypothetical protein